MTETNEVPETDQQRLEAKIAAIDKRLAEKKNLWLLKSRNDLQDYLETNFDADGTEIPPTPVESQLRHDFSPLEAQEADGYWTVIPSGFGDLPPWLGKSDPMVGLTISNERHAGCVVIKHLQDTAETWINDPEGVAASTSAKKSSPRIFAMAGYAMEGFRYFLPMFDHKGADRLIGFAVLPEIPVSDDERVAYKKNWGKYQAQHSFAGTNWGSFMSDLQSHGQVVWNDDLLASRKEWKDRVDPMGKRHLIPTIMNHPNWVVPGIMDFVNSIEYMRFFYVRSRRKAFRIDVYKEAPVPGYVEKDRAYRDEFEPHGKTSHIAFTLPGA